MRSLSDIFLGIRWLCDAQEIERANLLFEEEKGLYQLKRAAVSVAIFNTQRQLDDATAAVQVQSSNQLGATNTAVQVQSANLPSQPRDLRSKLIRKKATEVRVPVVEHSATSGQSDLVRQSVSFNCLFLRVYRSRRVKT